MSKLNPAEEAFTAAIPGESMTVPPGQLPFDRPAQISNASEALATVMKQIQKPKATQRILGALADKVPLDTIAKTVTQSLYGEGIITPSLIPHVALSLTEVFFYMAEQAGIKPVISTQLGGSPEEEITEEDLDRIKEDASLTELQPVEAAEEVGGLMAPIGVPE